MKCKIITGTKSNAEQQLQKVLDKASDVISMSTSTVDKIVAITIIYIEA